MAIATLTVDFVAKLASLQSGFDKATQLAEKNAQKLSAIYSGIGTAVSALAPAGAIAVFKGLVEQIDDLDKAAQRLGVNGAVELSGFRRAAQDAGVGSEEFDAALTKLNVKLGETSTGGKDAVSIFRALGVSVTNSNGSLRDSGSVLRDIADKFQMMADGPAKAALAVELFGKSGARLIPLLNDGGGALDRYTGLTDKTVDAAKKLQKEWERLGAEGEKLKNQIAGGLLPAVNSYLEASNRAAETSPGFLDQILKFPSATQIIVQYIARLADAQQKQEAAKRTTAQLIDVEQDEARARGISADSVLKQADAYKKLLTDQEELKKKGEQLIEQLGKRAQAANLGEFAALRLEAATLGVAKAAEPYIAKLERIKTLQEQVVLTTQEWERSQRRANEAENYTRGFRDRLDGLKLEGDLIGRTEVEQRKLTAAREIDLQFRQRVAQLPEDDVSGVTGAFNEAEAAKARASRQIDINLTGEASDKLKTLLDDINAEGAALNLTAGERQKAILLRELERKGIDVQSASYQDLLRLINEIGATIDKQDQLQIGKARVDDFADSVARLTGEFAKTGDINAFFTNLAQRLLDLTTQILVVEPLAKSLKDALNGKSGGEGVAGLLGTLGGWIGARAEGGPVTGGMPYLVGERGAELFVPKTSGSIVPNGRLGGNTSIVVNLPPDVPGGARTANQVAAEVHRRLAVANMRLN